jgi:hypothetical protein
VALREKSLEASRQSASLTTPGKLRPAQRECAVAPLLPALRDLAIDPRSPKPDRSAQEQATMSAEP